MSTSKKINVSAAFHQRLDEEARRLKISYKDYLEAAGMFFLARRIDPEITGPERSRTSQN